ncbi:MAG: type II secretion system major pseudopilin GspG [Phycisphaeraceae bacterium]
MKRDKTRSAAGFSILELLLVLVILAILAGIVGVRFAGQSEDARIRAAQAQLAEFRTALDAYEIKTGRYPTTQQGLDVLVERPSGMSADDWPGALLERVPDDQWGNEWQYRYPGTRNTDGYDLYSFGPDGREGGGDDITNWSDD